MAYAAQSDLIPLRMSQKDLTELTVDVPSGVIATDSAVTASVVTSALEEASGRVDGYCRGRYVTPLQQSDIVKGLTLDICVYLLFSRRRETKMSETVETRYKEAMAFLRDISENKASLDQPVNATPQSSKAGPQISQKDRHLIFDEKKIRGFV
jgi:phage gp36-like protein